MSDVLGVVGRKGSNCYKEPPGSKPGRFTRRRSFSLLTFEDSASSKTRLSTDALLGVSTHYSKKPLSTDPFSMEEDAHSLWKTLDDLKPEERKVLVRRTRKLEQVLGESLSERDVGQHIVRPGRGTIDEICALGGDWMSVNTVRGRSGSESAVISPSRSKHKWVADSHMHRSQSSHALALALGPDDDNEHDSWLQGSPQDRENTTTNASWIKRAASR